MELHIEASRKTPFVKYINEKNTLLIKGRSIPENAAEFYEPVINFITDLPVKGDIELNVNIYLDILNTVSSKMMIHLVKVLEDKYKDNKAVVNWFFEKDDEEMIPEFNASMPFKIEFNPIEFENRSEITDHFKFD